MGPWFPRAFVYQHQGYTDHIDLDTGKARLAEQAERFEIVPAKAKLGSSDTTGMGIIMECIAHSMGWISDQEMRADTSSHSGHP